MLRSTHYAKKLYYSNPKYVGRPRITADKIYISIKSTITKGSYNQIARVARDGNGKFLTHLRQIMFEVSYHVLGRIFSYRNLNLFAKTVKDQGMGNHLNMRKLLDKQNMEQFLENMENSSYGHYALEIDINQIPSFVNIMRQNKFRRDLYETVYNNKKRLTWKLLKNFEAYKEFFGLGTQDDVRAKIADAVIEIADRSEGLSAVGLRYATKYANGEIIKVKNILGIMDELFLRMHDDVGQYICQKIQYRNIKATIPNRNNRVILTAKYIIYLARFGLWNKISKTVKTCQEDVNNSKSNYRIRFDFSDIKVFENIEILLTKNAIERLKKMIK